NKGRYMLHDLVRWARHYDVPFKMSTRFPQNSLRAMRACTYAAEQGRSRELALALFRAYWVDDVDITSDQTIGETARQAGLDPAATIAACDNPQVKQALKDVTDEATTRGAFGAPTFFVGDDMFWGNDRLHFVEQAVKDDAQR